MNYDEIRRFEIDLNSLSKGSITYKRLYAKLKLRIKHFNDCNERNYGNEKRRRKLKKLLQ
jgi:hypothetical protein